MRRLHLAGAALALATSAVVAAPHVSAAAARCHAVSPGSPTCQHLSGGGPVEFMCLFTTGYCLAYVGATMYIMGSDTSFVRTPPAGTTVRIAVYGYGVGSVTAG